MCSLSEKQKQTGESNEGKFTSIDVLQGPTLPGSDEHATFHSTGQVYAMARLRLLSTDRPIGVTKAPTRSTGAWHKRRPDAFPQNSVGNV